MNSKLTAKWSFALAGAVMMVGCASSPRPRIVDKPLYWPVEDNEIRNDCGRIQGVHPVWIKGEPSFGMPTRIFAWWGLPKGASPDRKVPAMVLVHGGGGTAFAEWVKVWNDRGYAAIALDTCGAAPRGERDGEEHPRHPWSGPYGWGDKRGNLGPVEEQWPYHAISAVMRCNSFIRNRPEVDESRVGVTGISWGGYLTSVVAGIDHRFAFAAPVYGCGWYEMNPACGFEQSVAGGGRAYWEWLDTWDAKHYIGDTECPVLRCNGDCDRWFTAEMTAKSMDALPDPELATLSLKPRMPHGHYPWGDPQEIRVFADYYLNGGYCPLEIVSTDFLDGKLTVAWDAHDEKVVKCELRYLEDAMQVSENREWKTLPIPLPADTSGTTGVSGDTPESAQVFYLNLTTANGNVITSRIIVRE